MRAAFVACAFGGALTWAVQHQFGVDEIRRAESSRNIPLATARGAPDDWPGIFGPDGGGRVVRDEFPRELSLGSQSSWQIPVPGPALGGPCLWGELAVVPVVEPASGTLSLWAVQRRDGQSAWKTTLAQLPLEAGKLRAVAAPACDGQSFFLGAAVNGRLLVYAVDLQGRLRWVRDVGPLHCESGRLISPLVHDSLVIVAGDHRGSRWSSGRATGHLTAVHRLTGEIIWRIRRPNHRGLTQPVLADVAGGRQLVVSSPGEIAAFEPSTGAALWTFRWEAGRVAQAIAWNDAAVFAVSREPQPLVAAIRADGAGDVTHSHLLWQAAVPAISVRTPRRPGESLLCLNDDGLLTGLDGGTGKVQWRRRLAGTFTQPPLLAGDDLWCLAAEGTAFVVDWRRRGKIEGELPLEAGIHAPAAAARKQLLLRTRTGLWCIPWDGGDSPLVDSVGGSTQRL